MRLRIEAVASRFAAGYAPERFHGRKRITGVGMIDRGFMHGSGRGGLFPCRIGDLPPMRQLNADEFRELLAAHEPPCISLYQPTHRRHPENQQDPIRFRNLVTEIEGSLRRMYPARELRPLLEPFEALARDHTFWNHALDGLAVFAGPGRFRVFQVQRPVPELAVVAASFHAKPLVRLLQSADRYQVLGLNRREVQLFEGNRDALDEVELAEGVPQTLTQALGEELTEPHLTVASYGTGAGVPGSAPGATRMYHGQGARKDELDLDTERFFRAVDRAILEHHSRPSGLPLFLAALPEHHDVFRRVSHNPFLAEEGIRYDPRSITAEKLREEAWKLVEPRYLKRLAGLVESFREARSKQLGSDDLADVAKAAAAGRVKTLLIEAERTIPGKLDPGTGTIEPGDIGHPEVDDLLDDLAEHALRQGGDVVVVPASRMPSTTGLAAIYRY